MSFRSSDNFDPYRELQLSPDAEPELVKAAFKALAKKYHPDQFSDPREKARAEERMARINEAQRLLISGEYRPPREPVPEPKMDPGPSSPPPPPPPRPTTPAVTTKGRKSDQRLRARLSSAAFALFAVTLIAVLILPGRLSQNHLERALALEKQGLYQEALQELNVAVEQTPANLELYTHRARIWDRLGFPDRAEVDRANSGIRPMSEPKSTSTPSAP